MLRRASATGFQASDVWNRFGTTEHLGGAVATRRLIAMGGLQRGQRVLEAGCGTGYTSCLLAQEAQADVIALDRSRAVLLRAGARAGRSGLSSRIRYVQGDAHALPFASDRFEVVFCESVLVFCDQPRVLRELGRVLRPGGRLCSNEMTYLREPPPGWSELLSATLFGIDLHPHTRDGWKLLLEDAGLRVEQSETSRIHLSEQFRSHIEVDGPRRYLSTLMRGLAMPSVWRTFFAPRMWHAWREYPSVLGYGLTVARKPLS